MATSASAIVKVLLNVNYTPALSDEHSEDELSETISTMLARELYYFMAKTPEPDKKDVFDAFYQAPNSSKANMLHYLVKCFQKCNNREQQPGQQAAAAVGAVRRQTISFGVLVLKGFFGPIDAELVSFGCLIGRMMLSMSFPDGFVNELLVAMLADKDSVFNVVIGDTLTYLRIAAQLTPSKSESVLRPLLALRELISFQVPNTKHRPIATLTVERADWLPCQFTDEKNKASEIVATCFLGPFVDVNIMDDKDLLSQYADIAELGPQVRSQMATQLRARCAAPRAEMFQIVESFLKNVASRDPMINWLSQMAVLNIKRAGMHVVESEVASAGFILNILHVMHKLTSKVDVQKGSYFFFEYLVNLLFSRHQLPLSSDVSGETGQ